MNKNLIFIPGLFALGILAGIAMMNARYNSDNNEDATAVSSDDSEVSTGVSEQTSPVSWFSTNDSDTETDGDAEHVQALEEKIAELEARVVKLEATIAYEAQSDAETSKIVSAANSMNRVLTKNSLLKAGLSEETAADIVRRRNEIELRKLELRDNASREDYLGTARYRRELTALVEEQTTLREELGDYAYDLYLYANGQPNRVKLLSVMLGSSAEQAGFMEGDIVLTYGQETMFDWNELKSATSEGELGEYVNVNVLRDGEAVSLWVPRGPLGVRLGSARVEP